MNATVYHQFRRHANDLAEILRYRFLNPQLSPVRFVIFGRGRSGSTALVSLLDSIPHFHCDGEILKRPVLFPYWHVLAKCSHSGGGVYGCKILSYQVRDVQHINNREAFIHRLNKEVGFHIIYLRRENLLYHALSNIRARVFGFHKRQSDCIQPRKLNVNLEELLLWIKKSEELNRYERLLLTNTHHLALTYEEHLSTNLRHQDTAQLVCEFLSVEPGPVQTAFRKVSPRTLRDSVSNYEELVEFLQNTPYSKYLL